MNDELDSRKGRLYTSDWEVKNEYWDRNVELDDMADWTSDLCSRTSKERVRIFGSETVTMTTTEEGKVGAGGGGGGGIPTLKELSNIAVPSGLPSHPLGTQSRIE